MVIKRMLVPANKKALAPQTLGELIMIIGGSVIGLGILVLLFAPLFPALGCIGCGANIAIYAATVSLSGGLAGAPIFLCNQYREPTKINAADFNACKGIADFCKNAKGDVRDACYVQCARIQIDKLADACWAMGGRGQRDLRGPWWQKLGTGEFAQDIGIAIAAHLDVTAMFAGTGALTGAVAGSVVPGLGTAAGAAGGAVSFMALQIISGEYGRRVDDFIAAATPLKATVLRCSKFQVINPALTSRRQQFIFADKSLGQSAAYAISEANCRSMGRTPPCFLEGEGIKAARIDLAEKESEIPMHNLWKLNYEVPAARQVCYVSYHQYLTKEGGGEHLSYAVERDCGSWVPYVSNFKYLN